MGPEITHAMVVSAAPNSSAIGASETARIVIGNEVENIPASAAKSTHFGYRSLASSRSRIDRRQGATRLEVSIAERTVVELREVMGRAA